MKEKPLFSILTMTNRQQTAPHKVGEYMIHEDKMPKEAIAIKDPSGKLIAWALKTSEDWVPQYSPTKEQTRAHQDTERNNKQTAVFLFFLASILLMLYDFYTRPLFRIADIDNSTPRKRA